MNHRTEKAIKCVVWDLDNTLWDGVFLEDREVTLKPSMLAIIKELDRRGILQSIASKNEYEPVYRKLEELGIAQYFLYPEIHWGAKSQSIAAIQKRLGFGMDTFLFIDDQEFERDEVKSAHPEITCLPHTACETLLTHPRLNPRWITEDASRRRQMYQAEQLREYEERVYEGPREDFLSSLHMRFLISEAREEDLRRAEELTVRTNQLNSTGITYDYEELNRLRQDGHHCLLVCELIDKYGSYGKIGLALIETDQQAWLIQLLLMSCRVLTRSVGSVLLSYIMQQAHANGKVLRAQFRKTASNRMMYATYRFARFQEIATQEDGLIILENDLTTIPEIPPFIEVQTNIEGSVLYSRKQVGSFATP